MLARCARAGLWCINETVHLKDGVSIAKGDDDETTANFAVQGERDDEDAGDDEIAASCDARRLVSGLGTRQSRTVGEVADENGNMVAGKVLHREHRSTTDLLLHSLQVQVLNTTHRCCFCHRAPTDALVQPGHRNLHDRHASVLHVASLHASTVYAV